MKSAGLLLSLTTAACAASLPLSFEPNRGQAAPSADFVAHGRGFHLTLSARGAALDLHGGRIAVKMAKARAGARPEGIFPLPGKTSYLLGRDRNRWYPDIPTFARVRYRGIYPGIDVVYRGRRGQLQYDFELAPGAHPSAIQLNYEGIRRVRIAANGALTLETFAGTIPQRKPVIYQEIAGVRRAIRGRYVLKGRRSIGFHLGQYDRRLPLVIDPTLSFAIRLGSGGADEGSGISVDAQGSVYVAGTTTSASGDTNAFVTKLDSAGNVVFSAILGGSADDRGYAIAVDPSGRVSLTGVTASYDFPVAGKVFQYRLAGGSDAFVARLSPSGDRLIYSTYLGGSGDDRGNAIALDDSGNALVAGETSSPDLPTNTRAFQRRLAGGMDAFAARFRPDGMADFCTYFGGAGDDHAFGAAADSSGNLYFTGSTTSRNFPTTQGVVQNSPAGLTDAFVTKLRPDGNLVYSTCLGGADRDAGQALAVDSHGDVFLTGNTSSENFPISRDALQTSFGGGGTDIFIARLNATATALAYSTFLGGNGEDLASGLTVNGAGEVSVTGSTDSTDFPVVGNASQPGNHFGTLVIVSELNPAGSALLFSAVFGSPGSDQGRGIAAACDGSIYLAGTAGPPRAAFLVKFTGFRAAPGCASPTKSSRNR